MIQMSMYTSHDGTAIGRERHRAELAYWPASWSLGDEIRLLLRRVTTGGGSLVRGGAWFSAKRIRVSPMSTAWLRVRDADDTKHTAQV